MTLRELTPNQARALNAKLYVVDEKGEPVLFDKPDEFYTLDKLRRAAGVDRRLTLREILEKIFGLIPGFKS